MIQNMKNKIKAFWADPRGAFEQLSASAMSVVVFTITLALGALVLTTFRNNANVLATYNATGGIVEGTTSGNANASLVLTRGLAGVADLGSWTSIVVIVTVFSIILALIYGFYQRSK